MTLENQLARLSNSRATHCRIVINRLGFQCSEKRRYPSACRGGYAVSHPVGDAVVVVTCEHRSSVLDGLPDREALRRERRARPCPLIKLAPHQCHTTARGARQQRCITRPGRDSSTWLTLLPRPRTYLGIISTLVTCLPIPTILL